MQDELDKYFPIDFKKNIKLTVYTGCTSTLARTFFAS